MIKATGSLNGKPLLVLGLSRKNCELLLEGRPIPVDMSELGRPEQGVVLIVGGETEEHIAAELRAHFDKDVVLS